MTKHISDSKCFQIVLFVLKRSEKCRYAQAWQCWVWSRFWCFPGVRFGTHLLGSAKTGAMAAWPWPFSTDKLHGSEIADVKLGWSIGTWTNHKLGVLLNIAMQYWKSFLRRASGNPCKTAQSLGCSLQFNLLSQSCHTMGESFLDQRFDLLPDVCLVARALGHPIIGLNSAHIRQCLQLHDFIPNSGVFDRQLPLSDSIHMYSRCRA